nr:PREDICTED: transcription factor Adf-1-like isoform X2 [Linepithema humile]
MDHDSYFFDSQYQDENFCGENQYSQYSENENVCEIENQNEIDGDALLISLVRDYPYIYNKELTDFKDTFKKQNAWTEIASILNMTVDECQSRWTRLRERYTREKKQRQEETTTGSGASKRKTFEFFNNMQFLDPFVKKRSSPLTKRCISLQKNFNFSNEKENLSLANVATLQQNFSKVNNAELLEQNRFTSLSGRNVNVSPTNTTTLLEQQQSFTEINQAKINQR